MSRSRAAAALLVAALGLPLLASPARATPETLVRGISNVLLAPLDVALAPVATTIGIMENLESIDDSRAVRIVYPVPAWFYANGLEVGCAAIRLVTGLIEIIPGVPLAFMENDLDPLFGPAEDGARALVEIDVEWRDSPFRFGLMYFSSNF